MKRDHLDDVLKQWMQTHPDLNSQPMGVVGRILRLAGLMEQRANAVLQPFGLAVWGFDVLATLRRQGKPYSMTPTELMNSTVLSSGAMTNRIDRLEELGLVDRSPNESDRRSLRVTLTRKGLKLVDAAVAVRFGEAEEAVRGLTAKEISSLAKLLRKLLGGLDASPTGTER